MLEFKTLFKNMLNHFPKWMDIRKRANKSNGGQLVAALADETAAIQESIDDYQKDFFIESYFDKEDQVVSKVYRLQVGNIDPYNVTILTAPLEYTNDIKTFYKTTGYFYYESGYLLFRIEDINSEEPLQYKIDGYHYSGLLEAYQVWNVFDEFAAFVGIERHENESNLELEKRILAVFKEKINGTEDGLKYAIYAELLNVAPELKLDDITIEGVTPENIIKKYNDSTILQTIAAVNKDCYKYKRWDVDPWFYDVRSIDYIPAQWDANLSKVKDGVGKKDDLDIIISTPTDTTAANILFYEKNSDSIISYVEKAAKEVSINLLLTKFNNELSPVISKYKVIAGNAIDITNDSVYLNYYSAKYINGSYNISDIVKTTTNVTEHKDKVILDGGNVYRVAFRPSNINKPMSIDRCMLINDDQPDDKINILLENEYYHFKDDSLVNVCDKKIIRSTYDLIDYENIYNTENGLSLCSAETKGQLTINADDTANDKIIVNHGCEWTNIPDGFIIMNNFHKDEHNNYTNNLTEGESSLTINCQANSIHFSIVGEAKLTIRKKDDYLYNEEIVHDFTLSTDASLKPEYYQIKIEPTNNLTPVVINNICYTCYEISMETSKGQIIENTMPNLTKNNLVILLQANIDKAPYISSVTISQNPTKENRTYITNAIGVPENKHFYFDIKSENYDVDIYKVVEDGDSNETIDILYFENYVTPTPTYISNSNNGIIYLDLSYFTNVISIKSDIGNIRSYRDENGINYLIELKKDETISNVKIEGTIYGNKNTIYLLDAFGLDQSAGDKLYITNQIEGFICEHNHIQKIQYIKDIPELKDVLTNGVFDFSASTDLFETTTNKVYIKNYNNNSNNKVILNTKYVGAVKDIILCPKNNQTYIAYNQYALFQKVITNVELSNNFSPFISNELMCYVIENTTPELVDVLFENNNASFSVGNNTLKLMMKNNIDTADKYSMEHLNSSIRTTLAKTIPLETSILTNTGENVELSRYVITLPEGYEINYRSINSSSSEVIDYTEFYKLETIQKQDCGYNKLKYCNIDEIVQFGIGDPNDENNFYAVNPEDYKLLAQEGIIVWKDSAGTKYDFDTIYLKYTIKIPSTITVSDDALYKSTSYALDGYKLVRTMLNVEIDEKTNFLDLSNEPYFDNEHRIVVSCINPNFNAYLTEKGIQFNRLSSDNAMFVKTGYYYMDGKEYYLFSNENSDFNEQNINIEYENVTKDGELLKLTKSSKNYIANSMFNTGCMAEIYNKDFVKESSVKGISSLNAITACNTFNYWNTVGMNLSFCEGLNGVAIKFTPVLDDGYAYIKLTNSLFKKTRLSLFASDNIKVYIGVTNLYNGIKYDDAVSIDIDHEVKLFDAEENIFQTIFEPDLHLDYYLIIKGEGIVDDIVVINNDDFSSYTNYHTKNIDSLGLKVEEKISDIYTARLPFYNKGGYKTENAELTANHQVRTTANIKWGLTKIKEYNTYNDWYHCEQDHISVLNNLVITKDENGYILTEPIHIGDTDLLKTLIVKINDIAFNQMTGFTMTILTSDTYDGIYTNKSSTNNNTQIISDKMSTLNEYIKIKIEMPEHKMINNLSIFVEYKTTADKAPIGQISNSGTFISEIYDAHYDKNFILSNIKINSISNIKDVAIEIRAAKTNAVENIWTQWKPIVFDKDFKLTQKISFDGYRFFQIRIKLNSKDAYIDLDYIELESEE